MIERGLYDALNDSINRLAAGQNIEMCLRVHARYAAVLRPLLEVGQLARRAAYPSEQVRQAQARGELRLEAAMNRALPRSGRSHNRLVRMAATAAAVILMFATMLGGVVVVAEASLPDEPLYGVKRLTEQVRLTLSSDKPALLLTFEQRRVDEIAQLLSLGRETAVTFRGTVQSIDAETSVWVIAGLNLSIDSQTVIPPAARPGSHVEVDALTRRDGELLARIIRIVDGGGDGAPLLPLPTPTATESPAARRSPTLTPSPTLSPTTTQRPTIRPTETRISRPTSTLSTAPAILTRTATPAVLPRETASPCRQQRPQGWSAYTVQPGDRLAIIAQRSGTTVDMLVRVNCIRDPNTLTVGTVLYVPAPTQEAPPVERTSIPDERTPQRPLPSPTNTPARRS